MIETIRIEQWLYTLLSGDATLTALVGARIYAYVAAQGAAMPFVVFNLQDGSDVMGVGTARIMFDGLYQVKGINEASSFASLKPIADRIDTLLQGNSGSVLDGAILACTREQPLSYVETDEDRQYRHLGGLYRILAQGV